MLGSLPSIVTSESLTKKAVRFTEIVFYADNLYTVESRPEDKGRSVIYNLTDKKDMIDAPYSAKNGVHEYGGRTLCGSGDKIYFTNKADGQIYEISSGVTKKLTDAKNIRFAEPVYCQSSIFAIFEDHKDETNVKNGIMKIDLSTGSHSIAESEHDFYAGVKISPDKKTLAFFTWDFPNMSWDVADVWKVSLDGDQNFTNKKQISQKGDISSCDPLFSPEGNLYYISDVSGFWNFYKEDGSAVCKEDVDFTAPHWKLAQQKSVFVDENTIATIFTKNATDHLGLIQNGKLEEASLPFTYYHSICNDGAVLYFIAASPKTPPGIYSYDTVSKKLTEIKLSQKVELSKEWISIPREVSFKTRHGEVSHGFFYPPKNPEIKDDGEKPPLLLISHGGPTGYNNPVFQLPIQYWTSRGFAVCDVNYSGSAGFGRAYRNRLYDNWGIKDVDDCEDCALYLAEQGLVDKNRLAVRGGSAGGYTTLALLTFRDTFAAGASYFGVSDLGLLAKDTHKFESRYLDKLIGKYPEDKAIYDERSPLYHTDKMKLPILILQGDEDKVVPVEQAEKMYKALLAKNVPTAYLLFNGEGHGFCKKENIIKSIESELYFYQKIFGQEVTLEEDPIIIDNLNS